MADTGPIVVDHPRVRAWLEIREALERQLEPLGAAAMAALRPAAGERVLDVGCGIGGTPAALARAVGPGGRVVGFDLLEAAVAVMRGEPDLPANLSFACGDAQTYPFEAGTFDGVYSRFGLAFFDEPAAAFGNLRRALRPGGRLAFVSWRGLDDNELDHLPLRAAEPQLPAELVDATAGAGWFSLADPARLRAVLAEAGFADVAVTAHDAAVGSGSLNAMVEVCTRVGALGAILREHPRWAPGASAALEAALRERDGPAGPQLRAATWVVTARAG